MVTQGWLLVLAGALLLLRAVTGIGENEQRGLTVAARVGAQVLHVELSLARAHQHLLDFDYDAALAALNTALAVAPDDPALYVARGQVYLLLYEWDQVMADYTAALALDPAYADAYYYRGLLYYTTLVDRVNALPDFEQYLLLAPEGKNADRASAYAEAIRAEIDALAR